MTERKNHAWTNAGAGAGLVLAGELAGARVARSGSLRSRAASTMVTRGVKATGVGLAAHGITDGVQRRSQKRTSLREMAEQVAERTVPGQPKKHHRPSGTTLALAGLGLAGGTVARREAVARGQRALGQAAMATGGSIGGVTLGGAYAEGLRRRRDVTKSSSKQAVLMPTSRDLAEDQHNLQRRRRTTRSALVATTTGGAALALRAPSIARSGSKLSRIAPRTERASNALGQVAAATGTYSGVSSYRTSMRGIDTEQRKLNRQREALRGVTKRDDRFLREHRDRISTSAESGYRYLKHGRNKNAAQAGLHTALVPLDARLAVRAAHPGLRALGTGLAMYDTASAIDHARTAHRWNAKLGRIKNKAYERAAAGEYGRDRRLENLAKGLIVRPPGLPLPRGLRRAPALRPSGVRRTVTGKLVAYRGSYG